MVKLLRIHNHFFFSTDLAAQKAHFGQKEEFNRLSVSPLYNLLDLALASAVLLKSSFVKANFIYQER